ncbi:MAG: ABC transporter permease subunit [Rhodoferax sp.]|nr:ABC transporter permease subunit [Rhodoferax sp.]
MPEELRPPPAVASSGWQRLWPLLLLTLIWQLLAMQLHSRALPTPLAVLAVLGDAVTAGDLPFHLGKTLLRVGISFVLAMLLGVALGILMGRSRRWDSLLDSLLILGLNIPALVTTILCYIWFGLSESAAIAAVVLNKIPLVAITLREGARAVDASLLEVAQVYRLGTSERFFKVYLPQLYPYLFGAARNGLALIWKIVLVVELLGRSDGVGFQIGSFFHYFDISSILAYTLAFATIIFLLEALLLRPLENRLNRWRL